jgi:hypothetical protein
VSGFRLPMLARVSDLGAPDFSSTTAFAEWIEQVRAIAFFGGARHGEITKAEVAALLPHVQALRYERDRYKEAALLAAETVARMADTISALSDSDGSPKGGDACGSVHDSAGPKDIAQ